MKYICDGSYRGNNVNLTQIRDVFLNLTKLQPYDRGLVCVSCEDVLHCEYNSSSGDP